MRKITLFVLAITAFSTGLFAGTGLNRKKGILNSDHSKASFNTSIGLPVSKFQLRKEGAESFAQGTMVFSLGYGFPNLWKAILNEVVSDSAYGVKVIGTGPVHFRGEYGISDGVGFGVSVNYVSAGVNYTEGLYWYKLTRSSLSVLARLNFHFAKSESVDPYFGIGAGYKQATFKFTTNDPDYTGESFPAFSPFGFEATIGVRYYINDFIGLYTELGIAKSVIQAGLAVKL